MASNLTPIPPDKIGECHAWREWLSRIYMILTSTAPGAVPINHNALTGLQGGTAGEEYHLTNAQQAALLGGGGTTLHYHSSDRNLTNATGTLATANGGTGLTTIGTNGQVLESNGTNLLWVTPSTASSTASLAANGYQKLASGLIIQWGNANIGTNGTVTFPIAFPNAVFSVVATGNTPAANPVAEATNKTTSNFLLVSNVATVYNFQWVAIGY